MASAQEKTSLQQPRVLRPAGLNAKLLQSTPELPVHVAHPAVHAASGTRISPSHILFFLCLAQPG